MEIKQLKKADQLFLEHIMHDLTVGLLSLTDDDLKAIRNPKLYIAVTNAKKNLEVIDMIIKENMQVA